MSPLRQWLVVVVGPLAWLVSLQTAYALVPWACRRPTGGILALAATGVLALALGVAGATLAWREWRRAAAVPDDGRAPAALGRTRFMALTGLGTSALFVLVVASGILPLFLLRPCD